MLIGMETSPADLGQRFYRLMHMVDVQTRWQAVELIRRLR